VNSVATLDPKFVSALEQAVDLLRSVAECELQDDLQQRTRQLGENKEACSAEEREEHRQLSEFWRKQTLRKLQAVNVLQRLYKTEPLFHPRQDSWEDQFEWSQPTPLQIIGKTATARATIARLQLNHLELVEIRRQLARFGVYDRKGGCFTEPMPKPPLDFSDIEDTDDE